MLSGVIVFGVLAYMVPGLFISRWWWRRDVAPYDAASQVMAFWIAVLWPLYLICLPVYMTVRAFYGKPIREPEADDD